MGHLTVAPSGEPEPGSEPGPGAGPAAARRSRPWVWLDQMLRLTGGVVALAGGGLAAVMALMLVPLRLETELGVIRVPVAVVLAVAGNALLLWFARAATGTRWAVLLPAASWFTIMLPALGSTTEGSRLLMPNDWVSLLTLFGGTIVLAIGSVLALASPRPAASSL